MRILFWNTYRNPKINIYIVNLIQEYNIDILIMAEYYADEGELVKLLEKYNQNLIKCSTIGCNRIHIWSNYSDIKAGEQDTYYSIQIIKEQFILCCVHLMSDLYGDRSDERTDKIQQIMHDINIYEDKICSKRTMIMGDFSYPPGIYYLNEAKLYSPLWYLLDQVIISKDMLPLFKKDSLKIITTCNYSDLMDGRAHPNKKISDHFPIICEIEED